EELHHAQKPAGTDDRKAKRAVQAVLRRRRRPWEVRVVDNVGNPRGSPGTPDPARKANAVRECGATIDLDHFLQRPRRGHVYLPAAERVRLGIHTPAHPHDPVEAFANGLKNAWHGFRQRRRFHEHARRHVLPGEMTFARLPGAVGPREWAGESERAVIAMNAVNAKIVTAAAMATPSASLKSAARCPDNVSQPRPAGTRIATGSIRRARTPPA